MLWMPRIWSYEARMSYVSQVHSKSKAATLSDSKLKSDSDSDQEDKLMAFTATIEKEIKVECVSEDKEVLDESDLEKLDVQDDIQKAYEKLY